MKPSPLQSYTQIDNFFKQQCQFSRQQLLSKIYKKSNKPQSNDSIQKQLTEAFFSLLHNYEFDKSSYIVREIANIFHLNLEEIKGKGEEERRELLLEKMQDCLEERVRINRSEEEESVQQLVEANPEHNFEWIGAKSKYMQLRPIFQEILLEKVKMFDSELTRVTQLNDLTPKEMLDTLSTARQTGELSSPRKKKQVIKEKVIQNSILKKAIQKTIRPQFTNVKIRDKTEFNLSKWTHKQERQFQEKKSFFNSNLKVNNVPVLFQFVKKHTETVKARDNIYRKWEQREKLGMKPEQLRYLCATSLFLNHSLAKSEKDRIQKNVKSAGKEMISKLELSIAEKIIETYHIFMKKVSDLRAKYYEDLTEKRKKQQHRAGKQEVIERKDVERYREFLKYKKMFNTIVNGERMSIKLNFKVFRWVKLFVSNLKRKCFLKAKKSKSVAVINRLTTNKKEQSFLLKLKTKYPSAKVIKREDQYSHRLKYRTYKPSEKFNYESSFEQVITKLNSTRLNKTMNTNYRKQLTGGPRQENQYISVDLHKKTIFMPSKKCIKSLISIQAKWRAFAARKKYLQFIQNKRQEEKDQFEERRDSLLRIYPPTKKINFSVVKNRLRRVSMQISNILRPYVRVNRKASNPYTSFCVSSLTNSQMKAKYGRLGPYRLTDFGKMVEKDQYLLLIKSGIIVTSKEINDQTLGQGGNAMWWAVRNSNVELARIFLEGGGNPNSKDEEDNSCLHVSMRNGDIQIIFLLLDFGADLNRRNSRKVTPVFYATTRMLKLLGLEEGNTGTLYQMDQSSKDNNSLYYKGTADNEDVYRQHYY